MRRDGHGPQAYLVYNVRVARLSESEAGWFYGMTPGEVCDSTIVAETAMGRAIG